MKVHAAPLLLHDEGVEQHRLGGGTLIVGGGAGDVLHHPGAASSTGSGGLFSGGDGAATTSSRGRAPIDAPRPRRRRREDRRGNRREGARSRLLRNRSYTCTLHAALRPARSDARARLMIASGAEPRETTDAKPGGRKHAERGARRALGTRALAVRAAVNHICQNRVKFAGACDQISIRFFGGGTDVCVCVYMAFLC